MQSQVKQMETSTLKSALNLCKSTVQHSCVSEPFAKFCFFKAMPCDKRKEVKERRIAEEGDEGKRRDDQTIPKGRYFSYS